MFMKINSPARSILAMLPLVLLLLCITGSVHSSDATSPRLVLVVVVDQLGGDVPGRFAHRFGPDGFRVLMDRGTWYRNAHFQHANTVTAAGHATLATGGNPPQHGMIGNEWYDPARRRTVGCVEDERHGEPGGPRGAAGGRSPRNLTSSTFGDELVLSSGGRSRVFAVSIKDRAAITLGGHLGKAYWYSRQSGEFVTSTYYHEVYPEWMQRWNDARPAARYAGKKWTLLAGQDSYVAGARDDRPYELELGTFGRTFPHTLPRRSSGELYSYLRTTPMGDELTLSFVEALFAAERPGLRGHTDVLAVSFSVTDYIGHAFGPNSLEAEDNLLRLDRTLASLFGLVDREVGLDHTLVVLTSDHGVAPIPESLAEQGFDVGRFDPPRFMPQINAGLQSRFAARESLNLVFGKPAVYLDVAMLARLGLDVAEVENAAADELSKVPGVAFALKRSDLLTGRLPGSREAERVAAGFHPRRSGNVILVPKPFWYLDNAPHGNAAMHGSPYSYDTHVPILLAGPGVPRRDIQRSVAPRDLAPTLSAYLGIRPPSGSVGNPLVEVFEAGEGRE